MTTKITKTARDIKTISQARAAIAAINAKNYQDHTDVVLRNRIEAALVQVESHAQWLEDIRLYDAHGDVVLREQTRANMECWADTCMTPLAKRLAGVGRAQW